MAYTVKLFYNSGFDSVNLPDSPQLLNLVAEVKTFPSLQILQDKFLTIVRIKAKYQEIEGADFCQIGETYYSIEGYSMLNTQTVQLSLLMDAFTTGGGIPAMTIESGWLIRAHEKDSIDLCSNTLPEPFSPQEPLRLEFLGRIGDVSGSGSMTVIQSTINVAQLANKERLEALSFTSEDASDSCIIPKLSRILTDTTVKMSILNSSGSGFTNYSTELPGSTLYVVRKTGDVDTKYDNIRDGISNARSIGVESAITAQYNIPLDYLDEENTDVSPGFWQIGDITSTGITYSADATNLAGRYTWDVGASQSVKNYVGEFNKYILVSICSGSKVEMLPEDLYKLGEQAPTVAISSDLRSEGKPYAYFTYFRNLANNNLLFACEGLKWQTQPLLYSERSGSMLDRYNFQSSQYIKDFTRNSNVGGNILNSVSSIVNGGIGGFTGNKNFSSFAFNLGGGAVSPSMAESMGMSAATGAANALGSIPGVFYNSIASGEAYRQQKNKEIFNFEAVHQYVAPSVEFPRSEGIRDFVGNGFLLFRYRLSPRDRERYSLFLSMYGNAVSKVAEKSDFTNKTKFNFVQSDDLHITFTGKSKVINENASEQLRSGVRVWHILPSYSAYTSNEDAN